MQPYQPRAKSAVDCPFCGVPESKRQTQQLQQLDASRVGFQSSPALCFLVAALFDHTDGDVDDPRTRPSKAFANLALTGPGAAKTAAQSRQAAASPFLCFVLCTCLVLLAPMMRMVPDLQSRRARSLGPSPLKSVLKLESSYAALRMFLSL